MEHEHLANLKREKLKLRVSCPQCGKVLENQEQTCLACKSSKNTEALSSLELMPPSAHAQNDTVSQQVSPRLPQPNSATITIAQPASFKKRFLATIIDEIIIAPIIIIIGFPALIAIGQYFLLGGIESLTNTLGLQLGGAAIALALSYTIPYLYVALFEASKMTATPGKYILGLKVVSAQNNPITISDSIAKTLTQSLFYFPVFIFLSLPIVIGLSLCIRNTAIYSNQNFLAFLSNLLSLLMAALTTAVLSYPCFRKGTQSFMDLICNRFVVERNAATVAAPPLKTMESMLHKLHHLTSIVFWIPASVIVLAIPTLIYSAFYNLLSDFWLGIGLLILSWIACIWVLWKFRKNAGPLLAKAVTGIIGVALVISSLAMLPEYITRISNTPRAIQLIDQAIAANKRKDTKSYEKLRLEARAIPSYGVSYFILRNTFYDKPMGIPDQAYMAPRMWAITSGPGTPPKNTETK